jgi:CRP-like cAMP-binding protein
MLIDRFPSEDRAAFLAASSPVTFRLGQILYESGDPVVHVLFVETGIISAVAVMKDGRTVETYMVGAEGAANIWAGEGAPRRQSRLICQAAGTGRRIEVARFRTLMEERIGLRTMVSDYLACVRSELEQSVACNALHRADQRLAKWLLRCHDRSEGDSLHTTQESLAAMLGAQRTTVNEAAQTLQRAGAITYSRGNIRVCDRAKLQRGACECYEPGKHKHARHQRDYLTPALTRSTLSHVGNRTDTARA